MGTINYRRVLLGGLLAGLVINVGETVLNMVLLAQVAEAAMQNMAGWAMPYFVLLAFVWGIGLTLLYALIRPRTGGGPGTAIAVGVGFWIFALALPSFTAAAMGSPVGSGSASVIGLAWGLAEVCVAALAGAWVYREESVRASVAAG